jgi:TPR repeat protein
MRTFIIVSIIVISSLCRANGPAISKQGFKSFNSAFEAAQKGDLSAMYFVAVSYEEGKVVQKNNESANKWYRNMISKTETAGKSPDDIGLLGFLYEMGKGVDRDFDKAFSFYSKATELGSSVAMTRLGLLYSRSDWQKKDDVQAVRLFKQAADLGDAAAKDFLGQMLVRGRGIQKDEPQAFLLFNEAASSGLAQAQYDLGLCYVEGRGTKIDVSKGLEFLKMASSSGSSQADIYLGQKYQFGAGVQADKKKALFWYKKAQSKDAPEAGFFVQFIQLLIDKEKGKKPKPVDEEAINIMEVKAEKGDVRTQTNLAIVYIEEGSEEDFKIALKWLQRAAEKRDGIAETKLGVMYEMGFGVTKDYSAAMIWYKKGFEDGDPSGGTMMGLLYERGWGVPKDLGRAAEFYRLAAKQGNKMAEDQLKGLKGKI